MMKQKKHKSNSSTANPKGSDNKKSQTGFSEERVPTGIPGLDELMSGGFEKESVNIVSGGAGTGKSIFAMQFLVNGVTKFNQPGVFVTFEEEKKKVQKHMLNLGWDLKKLEGEDKITIIEYTPEKVEQMLKEGGGDIEWTITKTGAKRIVIDSLTAFSLLFHDELARRESMLSLFRIISRWGCTALLIVEHESDFEKHEDLDIDFEADGIILLYYIRKGDVRNRALEILKLRGSKHASRIFPMKITDAGVRIYPDEAVF
ncbi:hypothetical protein FJZ53_04900 [Candidatus Woesearchaeota archaeon]|nr:hypothetical protein [Candidatus Woesearchaeota archaeon]